VKVRREFPADPQSVPAARRFATDALAQQPDELRQSVELMVSELATNGIRHGQTSFELEIEQAAGRLRVAVTDSGGGTPAMRFPGPDEPTGRGLQIVDMLSDRWGVEDDPGAGKTVWFTLTLAGAAEQSEDATAGSGRRRRSPELTTWTFTVRRAAQVV
jgi:serine/threonine-protein kinase RsbW